MVSLMWRQVGGVGATVFCRAEVGLINAAIEDSIPLVFIGFLGSPERRQ